MTFTAGSLFSGIGGIDVAFAAAGFDIRFQVEIDDYCRKVLSKHAPRYWPNAAQHVDIRDVGRAELGTVDVLFGGFPCQDISVAGNGAGLEGSRSGLWYEFRRIIGDVRPRFVFIENVPAITSRGGTTVIAHLTALGYDTRWGIVGAADAGAPHRRERWFCVADAQHIRPDTAALGGRDATPVLNGASRPDSPGELARGDKARIVSRAIVPDPDGLRLEARPDQPGGIRQAPYAESAGIDDRRNVADTGGAGRRAGLRLHHRASQTSRVEQTERGCYWVQSTHRPGAVAGYRGERRNRAIESRLGGGADGLSSWLDRPQFPAGSGQPQHAWEAPRITSGGANRPARIKALGNAVVPQVVYPFAVEIARQLADTESHGD